MAAPPELITPAVVKVMAEMRRVVEGQVRADLARRWDGEGPGSSFHLRKTAHGDPEPVR